MDYNIPLTTYIQAPDVTEITSYGLVMYGFDEKQLLASVHTEFAWVVTADRSDTYINPTTHERLTRLGFSPLTRMKNHYCTHVSHKYPLTFWWRRLRDKSLPVNVQRTHWNRESALNLSGSGCGFKFAIAPLGRVKGIYNNYFSLIRVPNDSFPYGYEQHLARYNFRKVADGELATFFVNGWTFEEWTYEREMAWLNASQQPRDDMGRFMSRQLDPWKVLERANGNRQ